MALQGCSSIHAAPPQQQRGCYRLPARPASSDSEQTEATEETGRGRHRRPPWYIRLWLALHHER